jgi:hypothetical protein
VWTNSSPDVVRELRFHLYLNAFRNAQSTFMRESGGGHRGSFMTEDGWGWISIRSLVTGTGEDLTGAITFIQPDDGNPEDRTVIRVPLLSPVRPGASLTLQIDFTAQLPALFARTGYAGDFYIVGQWFPKIGVYEPAGMRNALRGGWNCHQFHSNSEFYADFGVYDVSITVPNAYTVGASGVLLRQERTTDSLTSFVFRAEDVHDFAWTASPRFVEYTDRWNHVSLRLLCQPEHEGMAARYLAAARRALAYMDTHVGRYPYPTLTIVDPPLAGLEGGGMEYPTLITGFSAWGVPAGIRITEDVTVHEFVHNYFYGMVATNEFEEPWMDEGLTQYYEDRIMDDWFGPSRSYLDLGWMRTGNGERSRLAYTGSRNPRIAPLATPSWEFRYGGYGLSYYKTSTFLHTLERMIGQATMDSAITTYFRRWRFRHPGEQDFRSVFNDVVPRMHGTRFGKSLDWFFDQMLHETGTCDYGVGSISSIRLRGVEHTNAEGDSADADTSSDRLTPLFESRVVVHRIGELQFPVDVEVTFDDGTRIRERWNGKGRAIDFQYRRAERVASAVVDPDNVLLIDTNRANNSRRRDQGSTIQNTATMLFLFWIQTLLQFSAILG